MNFTKDPDASNIDFGVNWAQWLEDGDRIVSSTWLMDANNPDSALTVDHYTHTDTVALVYLNGGTEGKVYLVTNRITTLNGITDDRTLHILVEQR